MAIKRENGIKQLVVYSISYQESQKRMSSQFLNFLINLILFSIFLNGNLKINKKVNLKFVRSTQMYLLLNYDDEYNLPFYKKLFYSI